MFRRWRFLFFQVMSFNEVISLNSLFDNHPNWPHFVTSSKYFLFLDSQGWYVLQHLAEWNPILAVISLSLAILTWHLWVSGGEVSDDCKASDFCSEGLRSHPGEKLVVCPQPKKQKVGLNTKIKHFETSELNNLIAVLPSLSHSLTQTQIHTLTHALKHGLLNLKLCCIVTVVVP